MALRHVRALFVVLALLISVAPFFAQAAVVRASEQTSIAGGETISSDAYVVGGSVSTSGLIQGDLVVAGGSLIISGDVRGDLLFGGGNIMITAPVSDDVRGGGGNVTIQSRIGGDLVVGGGQVQIGGQGVGGDIIAGAGSMRIDAPVAGSLRIGGGDVYINASIGGNADITADRVTLGPNARIGGNLTYTSGKEATIEDGAVVVGETTYNKREGISKEEASVGIAALISMWIITKFMMLLSATLMLYVIFRRYTEEVVRLAYTQPLLEIGRGIVLLIVLPVASVILLVTVIGIPLGIMGLLMVPITFLFGWIIAPIVLGSLIWRLVQRDTEYHVTWASIVVGVVAHQLLALIPIVGWIAQFAFLLLGLGAALSIKWRAAREWR